MAETSPHPNTVDEHVARIVAGFVVMGAAASLYEPLWWIIVLLAGDFLVRAAGKPRFSPLAALATAITRAVRLTPKPTYAPPKRFAAQVGLVFSVTAAVLHVVGAHIGAVVVTVALIGAASLEAFAGICVACWLYPYVFRAQSN